MLVDLLAQIEGQLDEIFTGGLAIAILIGLFGQLMFTARFLVQWIASERAGKSVVPLSFWFFSLAGGLILLGYAIYRKDPVFILGQATGVFIYVRNLMLIFKKRES